MFNEENMFEMEHFNNCYQEALRYMPIAWMISAYKFTADTTCAGLNFRKGD